MLSGVDQWEMRAGDADRQRVADRLREALNEGRLTLDEYDERVQSAYAAKTYRDLDGLLSDLPVVPADRAQVVPVTSGYPTHPAQHGDRAAAPPNAVRDWLFDMWGPWAKVNLICVAIWFGTSLFADDVTFWPAFVAVPWGLVLVVMTLTGLASGEAYRWAAKRQARRERKWARNAPEE